MSTGTDYFSALPVELISEIISFQDYEDRERCRFLSKFLYKIYKSTRTDFDHTLNASTVGVRVDSFVDRDKLDLTLYGSGLKNETSLEAYLRDFRVVELHLSDCDSSIFDKLREKGFTSPYTRKMGVHTLDLNCLEALPSVFPNVEYLEIEYAEEGLFTGTEPFKELRMLKILRDDYRNLLPEMSSLTEKMPSLIELLTYADAHFAETSLNSFDTLPKIESLKLILVDGILVPISTPNALTELNVFGYYEHRVIIEHPQPAPLSNLEIFGFCGNRKRLYTTMQYYGIGNNLKTIFLDVKYPDMCRPQNRSLDEIFDEDQVWKGCPNIEMISAVCNVVQVRSLVHVASICTKLRFVSFRSLLEDNGEFNMQLLSKTGIKDIFLGKRLPEGEVECLLNIGIDVVYD